MFIFTGNSSQNGVGIRIRAILNFLLFTLLFCATFADVAFRSKSHISDLSAPLYYDALSTEVLSPPFHYLSSYEAKKSRAGLGSAMIGSVTQALSPILPFAGGMDLRRDENWGEWLPFWVQNFLLGNRDADSSSIGDISSFPRGGSAHDSTNANSKRVNSRNKKHRIVQKTPLFSASAPFVSVENISKMTLADIALTFQYAIESSQQGFDRDSFQSRGNNGNALSKLMLHVIDAIENTSQESRGNTVLPTLTHIVSSNDSQVKAEGSSLVKGEVDTLKFCAAMRILAEWRILRQVPEGYKGYAVGMNLGHKDVVQNLGKIESVVHDWIDNHSTVDENTETETALRSPTLRQLLQHEIDNNFHPNSVLPTLKEKSAGMGLLWVRRQLHYQTTIFANVLKVPMEYPETKAAVSAAYTEVYGRFHGWAVQKIFNYSFKAAPQAELIYRHMNPKLLAKVMIITKNSHDDKYDGTTEVQTVTTDQESNEDVINIDEERYDAFLHDSKKDKDENLISHVNNIINDTSSNSQKHKDDNIFLKMGSHIESEWNKLSSHIQVELDKVGHEWDSMGKHVGGEWEKFGKHVGSEWDKLAFNVVRIFDHNSDSKKVLKSNNNRDIRGGARRGSIETNNLGSQSVVMTDEELEHYVDAQMEQDARRNIKVYLNVAQPLLEDLEGLFSEMNMDDLSKV